MRTMKKLLFITMCLLSVSLLQAKKQITPAETRKYWVETMHKMAFPVMDALSRGCLKKEMPIKTKIDRAYRVAYLEAFGRTFNGISAWLELGPDDTEEGKLRAKYIDMTIKAIDNATNPSSPDFMNFTKDGQPLVDAAYFAYALLRAETQIWDKLDDRVKKQVVNCFKSSRIMRTPTNNWLMFSATIEAFLLKHDLGGDIMRIDYAVNQHLQRYKGDGAYGDGDSFKWDYYNSFVIQPMLLQVVTIMKEKGYADEKLYNTVLSRLQRYVIVQERFISPEGTFPPIGRSLAYRTACFQALAEVAWLKKLPANRLTPAQVRCALTAVMKRTLEAPGTYDDKGWLNIGFYGNQPKVGERYINTGSLYMTTASFLPLGLPADDPFWTNPDEDWTQVKMYKGIDMAGDHSINN